MSLPNDDQCSLNSSTSSETCSDTSTTPSLVELMQTSTRLTSLLRPDNTSVNNSLKAKSGIRTGPPSSPPPSIPLPLPPAGSVPRQTSSRTSPHILSFPLPPSTVLPMPQFNIHRSQRPSSPSSIDSEPLATPVSSKPPPIHPPFDRPEAGTHAKHLLLSLVQSATYPESTIASPTTNLFPDLEVRFRERFNEWDHAESLREQEYVGHKGAIEDSRTDMQWEEIMSDISTLNTGCSCTQDGRSLSPSESTSQTGAFEAESSLFDDDTEAPFQISEPPTKAALSQAAAMDVFSQKGDRVRFGSIWINRKTIVCFIRHFFCPLCMDYCSSIARNVSPQALQAAGVQLIIISNGDPAMIKGYKRIFKMPFEVYTDPSLAIYKALGMTLRTMDGGDDASRGNYVRHGLASGIGMVVKNAVKSRMPLWKKGGTIPQLGGELILGPGLHCSFAHRMHNTRSHLPILQVIERAGIDLRAPLRWVAAGNQDLTSPSQESFFAQEVPDSVPDRTPPRLTTQSTADFQALLNSAQHAAKMATRPPPPRVPQDQVVVGCHIATPSTSRYPESGLQTTPKRALRSPKSYPTLSGILEES